MIEIKNTLIDGANCNAKHSNCIILGLELETTQEYELITGTSESFIRRLLTPYEFDVLYDFLQVRMKAQPIGYCNHVIGRTHGFK